MQIEWSVRGGSLRNVDSARVSIPPTLKYDDSKKWLVLMLPFAFLVIWIEVLRCDLFLLFCLHFERFGLNFPLNGHNVNLSFVLQLCLSNTTRRD